MPAAVAIPAIIGALGVGANIYGAVSGRSAAQQAAQTQAGAAENALGFQRDVYGTQQRQAAPYLAAGENALALLTGRLPELTRPFVPSEFGLAGAFNPADVGLPSKFSYGANDFMVDPGYQFALQQAQQAIERSAAARTGVLSGAAGKELARYTTGAAQQQYGTAYERALRAYQQNYANALGTYQQNYSNAFNTFEANQQNAFQRLNSLVGTGLTATGLASQAGQNYAANAGAYTIGAGNALAAGTIGGTNAFNAGLSGALNSGAGALGAYQAYLQQQQLIAALQQSGYTP